MLLSKIMNESRGFLCAQAMVKVQAGRADRQCDLTAAGIRNGLGDQRRIFLIGVNQQYTICLLLAGALQLGQPIPGEPAHAEIELAAGGSKKSVDRRIKCRHCLRHQIMQLCQLRDLSSIFPLPIHILPMKQKSLAEGHGQQAAGVQQRLGIGGENALLIDAERLADDQHPLPAVSVQRSFSFACQVF